MPTWRDRAVVDEESAAVTEQQKGSWYGSVDEVPLDGQDASEMGAVAKGANTGFVKNAPVVAGAYAGGMSGAALGAMTGPAAPFAVPALGLLGTIAGGAAGYMAGEELNQYAAKVTLPTGETLTFEDMESVPKNLRPYAVAGETFGGSIPYAAAPYMLARDGIRFAPNLAGRFFNNIIESAGKHPGTFAVLEAQITSGAALGAGAMEANFPGSVPARFAGELVGSILNPTRWVTSLAAMSARRYSSSVATLFKSGKKARATEVLQEIVVETGGNPAELAKRIRERMDEMPGLRQTAAQITGDPALAALEAKLASESSTFGAESKRMADESLDSIKMMIASLQSVGSPEALTAAAKMRQEYFDAMLSSRLRMAENDALETASRISAEPTLSKADYGVEVEKIMLEAMKDARRVESGLWGKIDKSASLPISVDTEEGILQTFSSLRGERLSVIPMPKIASDFVTVLNEKGTSTIGELLLFRSEMLRLGREAAARNEFGDARIYGELSEAALNDLASVRAISPEIDDARNWSRKLNDVFGSTFAGKAIGVTPSGQRRIPPEILMTKAFGGGKEMGELQLRQLEEAVAFASKENVSRLLDLQERTIRSAAARTVSASTGRVSEERLASFVRDNEGLLNKFPEVKDQLSDAVKAEKFLKSTEALTGVAYKAIASRSALAKVLKGEEPVLAISKALSGPTPEHDFDGMFKLAKRGGPDAVDGLKSSIYDYAYNRSGGDFDFSFVKYRKILDGKLPKSRATLRQMMVSRGLMNDAESEMVDKFLKRATDIEAAIASGKMDSKLDTGDALYDFVLRVHGAKAGALIPAQQGAGLVIAGAATRLTRQVFDKIPQTRVKHFLEEALKNPEMTASMLETPKSYKEKIAVARQMNAFLWHAGISTWDDGENNQ